MVIKSVFRFLLTGLLLSSGLAQAGLPIQTWETAAGARVMFIEAPVLPMVDIRVVFHAGSAHDGDLPGLARFTNRLLDEGAGEWDADELADRLASVGAELGLGSMRDMAWVSLRSLTEADWMETAVSTMETLLAKPHFDKDAIGRERNLMQTALQAEQQSPSDLASRAFHEAIYAGHPYASPPKGTAESLEKIRREHILAYYKRHYTAANAVIAIVGAVDKSDAQALADRISKALPSGAAVAAVPPVPSLQAASEKDVSFPSSQSHVRVGQPGIKRGDQDYYALYTGNYILGGSGLVSRLSEEIREKRGLSYSVYSYFSPMESAGPFLMGLQTRNSQTEEALGLLRDTLAAFVEKGPTAEELEAAKKGITGGFALRSDSNAKLVELLAMMGYYNLPLDYLDTFPDRIREVTAEQIREAFGRHLDTDRMATVIVGGDVTVSSN